MVTQPEVHRGLCILISWLKINKAVMIPLWLTCVILLSCSYCFWSSKETLWRGEYCRFIPYVTKATKHRNENDVLENPCKYEKKCLYWKQVILYLIWQGRWVFAAQSATGVCLMWNWLNSSITGFQNIILLKTNIRLLFDTLDTNK